MGSSVSCLFHPFSAHRRQVIVMKGDGAMLRFKEGSHVKDVLVAHPRHEVINCSSDRTLLPDSFQLSCNQLYFLLPKGVVLHDKTIERLLRIAASRDPTLFVVSNKRDSQHGLDSNVIIRESETDDSSRLCKKEIRSRWKPSLQTIPEVTLSALLTAETSPQGQRYRM